MAVQVPLVMSQAKRGRRYSPSGLRDSVIEVEGSAVVTNGGRGAELLFCLLKRTAEGVGTGL